MDRHAIKVVAHRVWLVLATVVILIGAGVALGGAVGYGLSWLVDAALGMVDF